VRRGPRPAGFLPATGTLAAFEVPEAPVVRWDSGVGPGSRVTVEFDPLLAKVIAHAPTRADAASALAGALERLHVGGVRTNRDFLAATLRHRAFLAGDTTTDFIERCRPRRTLELSAEELEWSAAAAALWLQAQDRASAPVLAQVSSGWRNARLPDQRTLLRHGDDELAVTYAAGATGASRSVVARPVSTPTRRAGSMWRSPAGAAGRRSPKRESASSSSVGAGRSSSTSSRASRSPAPKSTWAASPSHARHRDGGPRRRGRPGQRRYDPGDPRGDEDGAPHQRPGRRDGQRRPRHRRPTGGKRRCAAGARVRGTEEESA